MRKLSGRFWLCALPMLAGCVNGQAQHPVSGLPAGSRYVAMGSSYAAGPSIGTSADTPPNRCARSSDNYAHQLAQRLGLALVDVSCSGAMTAHILGQWGELPAQLDAVTPDTRLVTVTIGGNDVGFVSSLNAAWCRTRTTQTGIAAHCPAAAPPTEAQWLALDQSLQRITTGVRQRAPSARLIFLDYPVILPPHGTCAALGLSEADAETARATAARLAAVTARAVKASGATVFRASALSRNHDACSREPWMNGAHAAPGNGALFHPNLQAMTAIATALVDRAR